MKKLVMTIMLLGFVSGSFAESAASGPLVASAPAKTIIKSTGGEVVIVSVSDCGANTPCGVIKTSAELLTVAVNKTDSNEAMSLIQKSILPQVDFNLMTKFVMGPAWKQADPKQQAEITNLFKQLLVYQYSAALSKFKGAQLSIDSSSITGDKQNKAAVKGTFKLPNNGKSNNQPVNIEYDLAKIAGNWKIYDVKIENVSIVTTYRTQFNETVQSGGVNDLIKQLQTKVDNLTSKN